MAPPQFRRPLVTSPASPSPLVLTLPFVPIMPRLQFRQPPPEVSVALSETTGEPRRVPTSLPRIPPLPPCQEAARREPTPPPPPPSLEQQRRQRANKEGSPAQPVDDKMPRRYLCMVPGREPTACPRTESLVAGVAPLCMLEGRGGGPLFAGQRRTSEASPAGAPAALSRIFTPLPSAARATRPAAGSGDGDHDAENSVGDRRRR
jgi:hypothetical protein